MAVWLLHDNYDYINEVNYISATSLLRPIKQIILAKHVLAEDKTMDVSERISASLGNAIHDSLEAAWKDTEGRARALRLLGYPQTVIDRLAVNPTEDYLKEHPDCLPVWLEYRQFKEINGFKIGCKLDMILDKRLFDTKSTSVFTYIKDRKLEDHALQLSIYRWVNPDLIEGDHGYIQFVFTDWQKFMMNTVENYPQLRIQEQAVAFKSIQETESFIVNKTNQIRNLWDATEEDLPECTDKDLWRGDTEYKYYSDPVKAAEGGRSTRNFGTSKVDAQAFMAEKGKGVIKEFPGQVKACAYCPAYKACKQKDQYDV
jgi:hypothetical protein